MVSGAEAAEVLALNGERLQQRDRLDLDSEASCRAACARRSRATRHRSATRDRRSSCRVSTAQLLKGRLAIAPPIRVGRATPGGPPAAPAGASARPGSVRAAVRAAVSLGGGARAGNAHVAGSTSALDARRSSCSCRPHANARRDGEPIERLSAAAVREELLSPAILHATRGGAGGVVWGRGDAPASEAKARRGAGRSCALARAG